MPAEYNLTLCAIARDEAQDLAGMLESTSGLWDECVVVDTGSRDDTAAVAAGAGARVIHEPWRDDFSAARNRGLGEASGRWILVLDCDERLAPESVMTIHARTMRAADKAYALPQWNYTHLQDLPDAHPVAPGQRSMAGGAPTYVVAHQIRLFPNQPDLRYTGAVHEGIDAAATQAGLPVGRLDVPIHHYGHLSETGKNRSRNDLYGRLLRTKARHDPEDPLVRYELAVQLANEGRLALAERLLTRTVRDAPGTAAVHKARLLLGRLLSARGEGMAAARQTARAVQERPDLLACWMAAVREHSSAGLRTEAARFQEQALSLFPHDARLRELIDQEKGRMVDNIVSPVSTLPSGTALAKVESGKPVLSSQSRTGRP